MPQRWVYWVDPQHFPAEKHGSNMDSVCQSLILLECPPPHVDSRVARATLPSKPKFLEGMGWPKDWLVLGQGVAEDVKVPTTPPLQLCLSHQKYVRERFGIPGFG